MKEAPKGTSEQHSRFKFLRRVERHFAIPQEDRRKYLLKAVDDARYLDDRRPAALGEKALVLYQQAGNRLPIVHAALMIPRVVLLLDKPMSGHARELRRMVSDGELEVKKQIPSGGLVRRKHYYRAHKTKSVESEDSTSVTT